MDARSSGEKGWQSASAPTADCKQTDTPWARVDSSSGAWALGCLDSWGGWSGFAGHGLDFPGCLVAIADLCRP